MKKLCSVLALALVLCMLCSCALANEQKYDEPVTVHFVRSTDDTLDANYFSQHPDKTMTDNLWCGCELEAGQHETPLFPRVYLKKEETTARADFLSVQGGKPKV